MATAISLAERGVRVDPIDLDPEWRVYGAGITITRPTLRAYRRLGLLGPIKQTDAPAVTYRKHSVEDRIHARIVVGCDGFHGPSRKAIPASVGRSLEREYPFGWLGILADVPPCNHELIYANHERGFATQRHAQPLLHRRAADREGRGLEQRAHLG